MIELFQITGSASFAARAALEELGAPYTTVDIHPRHRDDPPAFAEVNPLRRVPSLREGDVAVYETGAVLAWLGDRFGDAGLAPAVTDPARRLPAVAVLALEHAAHGVVAGRAQGRRRRGHDGARTRRTSPASWRAATGASATGSRSPTCTCTC